MDATPTPPPAPVPVPVPLGAPWSGVLTVRHETTALERVQMGLAAVLLIFLLVAWLKARAEG